jgi:hypothetical protein
MSRSSEQRRRSRRDRVVSIDDGAKLGQSDPVHADLLLLNATNLPWRPIFPYAFVQVSAIARRNGLCVHSLDLLDVPRDRWRTLLRSHIEATRPRMIGLHIRQGDSVFLDDYYSPAAPGSPRHYFPVDDNQALVSVLRELCDLPVIAGGFGFTTHARRLFEYLGVDYGVQGDPDDVFLHFDDIADARDLATVRSLIHRREGATQINERGYYHPSSEPEYNDEIFDQLIRFYGHAQLFGANPPTIPVEVMRGCPFRCFFCTEPYVKGKQFRYRDLDAVEADLDFLMHRHIRRFWMICSELDIQGVKFGISLAERFIKLQERHGGPPVEWSAYALPRLEEDELRVLQRAGYAGALNDVLSLDDDNLRRARVPYRSKQAIAFLKAVTKLDREEAASIANAASAETKVRTGLTQRTPKELAAVIGLFLGNAHASPLTISTTLRRIEEEGLRENYRMGLPFPSTRVFAPDDQPICETTERGLRTYGPDGERPIDSLHPTFYYPDFLVERLGSPAAIITFMRYVGETFMSTAHRARKDWAWFLTRHVSVGEFVDLLSAAGPLPGDSLAAQLARESDEESLRRVFAPPPEAKPTWNLAAHTLIEHIFSAHEPSVQRVRDALSLPPPPLSEYRLAETLYARFNDNAAVLAAVIPRDGAERLYVAWLLYAHNVVFHPAYRSLLFGTAND